MGTHRLSAVIRMAFESALRTEVAAGLAAEALQLDGIPLVALPASVRAGVNPFAERDRIWRLAVHRYREGPRSLWGPVILEMLAPALVQKIVRLQAVAGVIEEDDLVQQVVADALETVATLPIPEGARYMERRLVWRTFNRTLRWLARQYRITAVSVPINEPRVDQLAATRSLLKAARPEYAHRHKRSDRRRESSTAGLRGKK